MRLETTAVCELGPVLFYLPRIEAVESMSGLFRYQVDLDFEFPPDFRTLIGKKFWFRLEIARFSANWHGIIRKVRRGGERVIYGQKRTRYRVTVVPEVWRLTLPVRSRIFQNQTAVDILKQVFSGYDVNLPTDYTPVARECCVQYGESDFAFASRLLEDEGIAYYFKEPGIIGRPDQVAWHWMTLGSSASIYEPVPTEVQWAVGAVTTTEPPPNAILSWEKCQRLTPTRWALRDYSQALADLGLETVKPILGEVVVGGEKHFLQVDRNKDMEVFEYHGGLHAEGSSKSETWDQARRAGLRAQEGASASLWIKGVSTCPQLRPGRILDLGGRGKFLVTHVKHVASLDPVNQGDGRYENHFRLQPYDLPFRPPRRTPKPRVAGPLTAVVMGDVEEIPVKDKDGKEVKDQAGQPVKEFTVKAHQEVVVDKHGRIKVQFHWDRQGVPALKAEGHETSPDAERPSFKYWPRREGGSKPSECWLRFAQPQAGRGWGHIAIPRVGQEVLVGFLDGDPDRPVVIGSVYNSANVLPFLHDGHVQGLASGWKSHTADSKFEDKAFNGIAFNDAKDRELAYLHAQRNLILNAKQHMVTNVVGNHYEHVAGHKLKLTGSLPGFGEATPGKDDHHPPAPHSSSGDAGHHGDFEGVPDHLWEVGPVEAKLAKEIEISYGVEMGAHLGLKLEALFGGKTEFTISPSMLLSELPLAPALKLGLASVLGTIDGANDYHMGPKFGFHLGAESEIKLAAEIHIQLAEGSIERKLLRYAAITAVVLAIADAAALGMAARHASGGHELPHKDLSNMLNLTSLLGIALGVLVLAQVVIRTKAAVQGVAHHVDAAAAHVNAPVVAHDVQAAQQVADADDVAALLM